MTHFEQFRAHFDEHAQVVSSAFDTLAAEMEEYATRVAGTIGSGGRLFFCGNGGSAADASIWLLSTWFASPGSEGP